MRIGRDNSILTVTGKSSKRKGCIRGINLGADYCAEHEWGIQGIRRKFGMTSIVDGVLGIGVETRRIREIPSDFVFVEGVYTGLFFTRLYNQTPQQYLEYARPSKTGLWTAWDQGSFASVTMDGSYHEELKRIHQAFTELDIAIWLGGGGVFQNAGLCFGIISNLSKEVLDNWAKHDIEKRKLDEDVVKLGILDRLEKAGKGRSNGYYACSPIRQKDGSIMFWLNPCQQNKFHSCLVSVKDLDDWIAGKGRVIKTKEERERDERHY
jgi:hypothetical protein